MGYIALDQKTNLTKKYIKQTSLLLPIIAFLTSNMEIVCNHVPKGELSKALRALLEPTINNDTFLTTCQAYSKEAIKAFSELKKLCLKDKSFIEELIKASPTYSTEIKKIDFEEFKQTVSKMTFNHLYSIMLNAYNDTHDYIIANSLFDHKTAQANFSDEKENAQYTHGSINHQSSDT